MKGYELIKVWRRDGFRLSLYDTYRTDSMGKSRLAYRFSDHGKVTDLRGRRLLLFAYA